MKELSVEEKAKAYDEAKLRMSAAYNSNRCTIGFMNEIFPELAESEDERMIKSMTRLIKAFYDCNFPTPEGFERKDMLTWLKGELAEQYRQSEQKPVDKVEPKFKAGDWVVCNNGPHHIFQVIERSWPNAKYRNINGIEIFLNVNTLEKQYHLWTIKDAKAGDVLACENDIVIFKENSYNPKDKSGCMFVYCSCNNFYEIGGINPTDYKPATKEQRDLLFSKMKEASYEWDADKKELKKIEQKPAVWSDEDEEMLKSIKYHLDCDNADIRCYGWIEELKDRVQPQPKQEWSEDDEQYLLVCKNALAKYQATDKWDANNISNWLENKLKSLRPQPQWKPSDEQLDALESATENCAYSEYQDCLRELIGQLKKLREDKL